MKPLFKITLCITMAYFFTSCNEIDLDNGPIETEQRTVDGFSKINMDDGIDVVLLKGSTQMVEVSDHKDLIKDISVKVADNVLYITSTGHDWINNSQSLVTITVDDVINDILLDGSGDLLFKSDFNNLKSLEINGSGCVASQAQANYAELDLSITGSGDVSLKGKAEKVNVKINGSGDVDFYPLTCADATIKLTGSGDVKIDVTDTLDVNISGSGDVFYTGDPKLTSKITGSGELKKK